MQIHMHLEDMHRLADEVAALADAKCNLDNGITGLGAHSMP